MASWELKKLKGNTWYISSPVNIGLYRAEGSDIETVLIDSGNDKEAGRQIRKKLDEKRWSLSLIINTHSNADHIGGNEYLKKVTGCSVAAPVIEGSFTRHPLLEPSFLWGGYPFRELRNKFLMAKPSAVDLVIEIPGPIGASSASWHPVPGTPLEVFSLPGHFLNMIGVRTPDNVVFLADTLFSEEIISKYRLVYLYDIAGYLKTLDILETLEAEVFVPSHAPPKENIASLVEINRKNTLEVADMVVFELADSMGTEELLKKICDRLGLQLDYNQYVLLGSTIKSYLSYLHDQGHIVPDFQDNRLFWQTVK